LLCYGRPKVRGRDVFGDLVPWGELWRTGANEPTTLHLPFAAEVAGLSLPRGRYTLYTIPNPGRWQLVVNRSTRQPGRTREETGRRGHVFPNAYTEAVRSTEVARVPIDSCAVDHVEALTARAEAMSTEETVLLVEWARVQVSIPVRLRGV
jgi:hypothetical protein